ncbi:hypothetical protein SAMN05192529_10938 [Arachidicoccus rhizosphaerae]|uniref:Mobilisation protein (MobC) n=1 Tax=Arachidicoccus rhizosphaerae TaxID=551991 RepID=A0A1H3YT58_9BACT|nr:hypothetical protein [Arachidicoccus rhizosphaerae]SEA14739.1 hypothetical protein SAMN05192529_10938 [Arachidicoccus rhizosphaerae]
MIRKKRGKVVGRMRVVSTRIREKKYEEFRKMMADSSIKTMSELFRHILENRKITLEYYDKTLDKVMLELADIRRELLSIGVNINQVTKRFHVQRWPDAMLMNAREIALLYQEVDLRIKELFDLITKIAQKWLPE